MSVKITVRVEASELGDLEYTPGWPRKAAGTIDVSGIGATIDRERTESHERDQIRDLLPILVDRVTEAYGLNTHDRQTGEE